MASGCKLPCTQREYEIHLHGPLIMAKDLSYPEAVNTGIGIFSTQEHLILR